MSTVATAAPACAVTGMVKVVPAPSLSTALWLACPTLIRPLPFTVTLAVPSLPDRFLRSRLIAALSPAAITRGVLGSTTSGARTVIAPSASPKRSPVHASADNLRLPLKSGTSTRRVALPWASNVAGPLNRSTICTLGLSRAALGKALPLMSPP